MTDSEKLDELWVLVMATLKDQVLPSQYDGYLRQIRPLKHDGSRFHVAVPSGFIKEGVEKILKPLIVRQLTLELGSNVELFVQVEPSVASRAPDPAPTPSTTTSDVSVARSNLNPKYRMEYYVVGGANRFAHAASLGVIKNPGEVYNPLFLWGPVGVGKTHLMQAIGHRMLEDDARRRVVYVTAEVFTSECIDAIREQTTKEFQRKYRTVDLLLIDDVQFFEHKEHMQEAFFHTFNELYQKRKQIVLSSDRPPKALDKLQERLVSRFESGLTADIKAPDLETREAILRELADRQGLPIDPAVLTYLAAQCPSSVRELEGSFNRVAAFASLTASPFTISLIESVLEDVKKRDRRADVTPELIADTVAEHFHLKREDLISRRQDRQVVVPRQIAMFLIYEILGKTLKDVARFFGKKDHSTVIHSCEKVKADLDTDGPIAQDVKVLKLKLKEMRP